MRPSALALLAAAMLASCAAPTAPSTIRNFRAAEPAVHCAGQPSEAQLDALPAAGYSRVIHMRLAGEKGTGWEEARAKELGLEFVRLPIKGAEGLTRENVALFAAELAKPTGGTTLVSCGSSNRVGAMFGLKAFWHDGKTAEEAMQIAKAHGVTRLEPKLRELLK